MLADTERDGHLPAFNQTFADAGVPIHWSQEEYGQLLAIGGGKERLASVFTPVFVETAHLPTDPDEQRELIAAWHKTKTAHYTDMVAAGVMPARPGIARIVEEAAARGWRLAVASTSAEASVRAVLEHAVGADRAARLRGVRGRRRARQEAGARHLPAGAASASASDRDEAIVVEDSANGLRAALGAGPAHGRHGEQLHRRRGLHGGVPRRHARSATSRTTPRRCSPTRTAWTPVGEVHLTHLEHLLNESEHRRVP